jgi:FeS assembly SUF system protein
VNPPSTTQNSPTTLEDRVIQALRTCYDPEIPVNIYELGLIYDIIITEPNAVTIKMTLTSPFCPVAESLPGDVESTVRSVPGVSDVKVEVVFDPPWDLDMMSDKARLALGY